MINAKQLYGTAIAAEDGDIGSVHDLYFDDHAWTVRYLVIDTGKWLPGRKVLIVPDAILPPWHGEGELPVALTMDQIRSSPDIDTAQPVSRQAEGLLHSHYGWAPYWSAAGLPVAPPPVLTPPSMQERRDAAVQVESLSENPLRSTKEVIGYHVRAADGEIGHIQDILLDDDCNRVLFFVLDLDEWIVEKQVLLSPTVISEIDWAASEVQVELSLQAIKSSQEYKPAG